MSKDWHSCLQLWCRAIHRSKICFWIISPRWRIITQHASWNTIKAGHLICTLVIHLSLDWYQSMWESKWTDAAAERPTTQACLDWWSVCPAWDTSSLHVCKPVKYFLWSLLHWSQSKVSFKNSLQQSVMLGNMAKSDQLMPPGMWYSMSCGILWVQWPCFVQSHWFHISHLKSRTGSRQDLYRLYFIVNMMLHLSSTAIATNALTIVMQISLVEHPALAPKYFKLLTSLSRTLFI